MDDSQVNIPAALRMLCAEVGGQHIRPGVDCGGRFCSTRRPPLPTGAGALEMHGCKPPGLAGLIRAIIPVLGRLCCCKCPRINLHVWCMHPPDVREWSGILECCR